MQRKLGSEFSTYLRPLDNLDNLCNHDCMGTMILRNIPNDLRKQFKLLCLEKNTNMTEAIIDFMKREVAKGKPKK